MSRDSEPVEVAKRQPDEVADRKSRLTVWLLLTGDRWIVAALLLLGILAFICGLLWIDLIAVADGGPLSRAFAALVAGNLTLITIVISINQMVLSREFGTPAELEGQIEEMMDYRRRAEETAQAAVSPTTPSGFLELLFRAIRDHALSLQEATLEAADGHHQEEVEEYVTNLLDQTEGTTQAEGTPTQTFSALLRILEIDFTDDLHTARWFRTAYDDSHSSEVSETFDELIELFEYVGVLRQYLETLYLQRELALFSRRLFYVGIPAVVFSLLTIWVYGPLPGTTVDGVALQALVVLSTVVAFGPLAFFFAYILRIATVTRRTAALMPFNLRE